MEDKTSLDYILRNDEKLNELIAKGPKTGFDYVKDVLNYIKNAYDKHKREIVVAGCIGLSAFGLGANQGCINYLGKGDEANEEEEEKINTSIDIFGTLPHSTSPIYTTNEEISFPISIKNNDAGAVSTWYEIEFYPIDDIVNTISVTPGKVYVNIPAGGSVEELFTYKHTFETGEENNYQARFATKTFPTDENPGDNTKVWDFDVIPE